MVPIGIRNGERSFRVRFGRRRNIWPGESIGDPLANNRALFFGQLTSGWHFKLLVVDRTDKL